MKEIFAEGTGVGRKDYTESVSASGLSLARVHQTTVDLTGYVTLPGGYFVTTWGNPLEKPTPIIWFESVATAAADVLIALRLRIGDKYTHETLKDIAKHYGYGTVEIPISTGIPVMRNEDEILLWDIYNDSNTTAEIQIKASGIIDYIPSEVRELKS